jgi:hypothetical protein
MAAASVALGAACDVFLCHAGGQTSTFMDCLHRILFCVGGNKAKQQRALKVFLDPHRVETGSDKVPWPVTEHTARNCRIGGHVFRTLCHTSSSARNPVLRSRR